MPARPVEYKGGYNMKKIGKNITCILFILLIICFTTKELFSQPVEQEGVGPGKEKSEKLIGEDLEGRSKWLKEQRVYPGKDISEDARKKAVKQKARMAKSDKKEETGEEVIERDRCWNKQRAYPSDSIPVDARKKAVMHKAKMRGLKIEDVQLTEHHSAPVSGICNWESIGPRNINGRIRSLAIHPTNGDIVYAGAAEGGLWKSTDAGQSWFPLMQYEDSIAVGAIAIDPTNPDIIYIGTGEPTWWPGYEGVGVLKSTDGGVTWFNTGAIGNGHIARLAIDPTNTNTVYCAGLAGGLYKTTNGGTSWTLIKAGDVTDFALHPSSTNTMYTGVRNDGVYKSSDGGATWSKLAGGLPVTASQRVMLSISASSPQTVYAKLDKTVYKTTNGGTSWSNLGDHGGNTYGYWCNYVAVDPTNPNIVFAGGVSVERTTDGGATWNGVAGGTDQERDRLHGDNHAMVFDPANHLRIYAGNDGGVYLSTDGANTWKKVSDGLIVTQFYDVGISAATPSMLGGGVQDQGTNATVGGLTWHKLFGGDGGFLVFHPNDSYTVYGESQHNNMRKSTNGGKNWSSILTGITGSGPWIGAIVMDDTSPNTLFTGRQEVFKTTNGAATWNTSSPTVGGGSVQAIAIAPSNHQIVYVGTSSGMVWKSTDGGATLANWSNITSAPLPGRYVKDIAVDRTDPDIVYLTNSGFNTSTPGTPGHVFRSTDGGSTWIDISGTAGAVTALPDIPANAIEIDAHDANTLYVGTDIGIFRTTNLGGLWTVFEPGLPHVAVNDLELDESLDVLTAATHGRGMWQMKIGSSASCSDKNIYLRDDLLDTGQQIPSPSNAVDPFSVVRGGSIGDKVYWWQSPDIKVDSLPYYTTDALFDGVEFDRDLIHDKPVRTKVNKVYIQVHNRGPFNANNVTVKLLWADASAGLPTLPTDFWTTYPNDSSNTSIWHPIGTYQTISVLEATRPVILSWNWTPPAGAATHSCIIAVIDSPDDPIPTADKILNVGGLVPNSKHVTLKNLHVINAPPGPMPMTIAVGKIYFYNPTKEKQVYDFVFDRQLLPDAGKISMKLPGIKTSKPLKQSVEGIEIIHRKGWWLWRLISRIFPFFKPSPPELKIATSQTAVIKGVTLNSQERIGAEIKVTVPPEAKPGDKYRFTIIQKHGERIVGGSTYEIRITNR